MSKTKRTKRQSIVLILSICLLAVLTAIGSWGMISGLQRARAQVNVAVAEEIADEYAFGDLFSVPACTFEKGGKSAEGTASLQYPDGTQTGKTRLTLDQSGRYVLRYLATLDGVTYTKEYPFTVQGRLAAYASEKTVMEYGECTAFGATSVGLNVQIANGDSLAFEHVFDMTAMTSAIKLLEGFVVPTTQGSVDFTKMVFTFTDAEDPTVQLIYHGNFHDDTRAYGLTYFTAAGNGQVQAGLEYVGKLHKGGTLGCVVPHSFMAMDTGLYWDAKAPTPVAPDSKTFCISYDAKNNQAWAGGKIIADLDDSNYYDKLWLGFPSGKAKLTVSALNYNGPTANFCFTSILGVDLSAEHFVDDEAPTVSVDNEYEVMPNAAVGGSYPVPNASAQDGRDGVCDVNVSVWYGYGTDGQKMVDIQDGRFAVDNVGTYAIVYEATDRSGNVGKSVLWVRAYLRQYIPELTVTLEEGYETEVELGVLQTLPNAVAEGGSGDLTVFYELFKGAKNCEIENGKFRLEEKGEWTLVCTAVDYVGNTAVSSLTLNGVASGKPVAMETPYLPIAYISGANYVLPELAAFDYTSGEKVQKACSVRVECEGTTETYQGGDTFMPTVSGETGAVKLSYVCDGTEIYTEEVPVVTVFGREQIPDSDRFRNVLKVEKYFYTKDEVTFENKAEILGVNGLKITANESKESVSLAFINAVLANDFSLDLFTVAGQSKFSAMQVTLTDSENSELSVTATLAKGDGETLLSVGGTSVKLTLDFDGGASAFNVGYDTGNFIVNGTTGVPVGKTDRGEAFNGFPSGKIYFEIRLMDVQADAAIFLSKICGVNAAGTQDNASPAVEAANTVKTNAEKDEVYTLQRVLVADVLCPNAKASLTVMAPDGSVATSVDGIRLQGVDATRDYQIKMALYGNYSVVVVVTEGDEWRYVNEGYFEYAVSVLDTEAPTINFKGNFKSQIKVGDRLVIPSYEVADNHTATENLSVVTMIVNPKGMPVYLYGDTNAVTVEYAGVYRVYIYVYDEMGNVATYEASVTAK